MPARDASGWPGPRVLEFVSVSNTGCLIEQDAEQLRQSFELLCSHWQSLGVLAEPLGSRAAAASDQDRGTAAGPFQDPLGSQSLHSTSGWQAWAARPLHVQERERWRGANLGGLLGFAVPVISQGRRRARRRRGAGATGLSARAARCYTCANRHRSTPPSSPAWPRMSPGTIRGR